MRIYDALHTLTLAVFDDNDQTPVAKAPYPQPRKLSKGGQKLAEMPSLVEVVKNGATIPTDDDGEDADFSEAVTPRVPPRRSVRHRLPSQDQPKPTVACEPKTAAKGKGKRGIPETSCDEGQGGGESLPKDKAPPKKRSRRVKDVERGAESAELNAAPASKQKGRAGGASGTTRVAGTGSKRVRVEVEEADGEEADEEEVEVVVAEPKKKKRKGKEDKTRERRTVDAARQALEEKEREAAGAKPSQRCVESYLISISSTDRPSLLVPRSSH